MGGIWMRWAWRDFRSRWLQIVTTALILAVGIGAFAGVGGVREWRERSTDQSLAALREHDLRVDLAEGGFVRAGRLTGALRALPDGMVAAAEERLIADSQLDASRPGRTVLVPARVVGLPTRSGGQSVDRLAVKAGRGLTPSTATAPWPCSTGTSRTTSICRRVAACGWRASAGCATSATG